MLRNPFQSDHVDFSSSKLNNLNLHPLEALCRYHDSQLQVIENYSYFFQFETKHLQILISDLSVVSSEKKTDLKRP